MGGAMGRVVEEVFAMIVGTAESRPGDGIVPQAAAHLDGAEQITFDDVLHGMIGSPWYGDDDVMDGWWPQAVRLWEGALAARAAALAARSEART